ncbi:MAG: hypothetical protein JWM95_3542 [Gemmatimonadetes bacterium]|nr:hypothetical protein [Gemmatimonadota bacterium]
MDKLLIARTIVKLLPPPRTAPPEQLRLIHVASSSRRSRFGARWWHKWIGVVVGVPLLFLAGSGIVSLIPGSQQSVAVAVTPNPINWTAVIVSPAQAGHLAAGGLDTMVRSMALRRIRDTVTYVVRLKNNAAAFVNASTGQVFRMTDSLASKIASTGLGAKAVEHVVRVGARPAGYRGALPAWHVVFDDGAGTEAYVVDATGDVVRSSQSDRFRERLIQNLHSFAPLDETPGKLHVRKGVLMATCIAVIVYVFLGFWLALPKRIRGSSR